MSAAALVAPINSPKVVWNRPGEKLRWQKAVCEDTGLAPSARCMGWRLFMHCMGTSHGWAVSIRELGAEIGLKQSEAYRSFAQLRDAHYARQRKDGDIEVIEIIPIGCEAEQQPVTAAAAGHSEISESSFRNLGIPTLLNKRHEERDKTTTSTVEIPPRPESKPEPDVAIRPEPSPPDQIPDPPPVSKPQPRGDRTADELLTYVAANGISFDMLPDLWNAGGLWEVVEPEQTGNLTKQNATKI